MQLLELVDSVVNRVRGWLPARVRELPSGSQEKPIVIDVPSEVQEKPIVIDIPSEVHEKLITVEVKDDPDGGRVPGPTFCALCIVQDDPVPSHRCPACGQGYCRTHWQDSAGGTDRFCCVNKRCGRYDSQRSLRVCCVYDKSEDITYAKHVVCPAYPQCKCVYCERHWKYVNDSGVYTCYASACPTHPPR